MLRRLATVALIVMVTVLGRGTESKAKVLTAEDTRTVKAAFKAIDKAQWRKARRHAKNIKDPVARKIMRWLDLTNPETKVSFRVIDQFMADNPDWPGQGSLQLRAEQSMTLKMVDREVLRWFSEHAPISTGGWVRYASALLGTGEKKSAAAIFRQTWIGGTFSKRQQKDFYRLYHKHLTKKDHVDRLDRLIWDGAYWPARRMLWKVDPGTRALALARLMLMRRQGNVDKAIAKVPDELKDDPGLIYERLRWRRRKGKYMSARMLLSPAPENLVRPEKWWKERAVLARSALNKGHISEAYRLAKDHRLETGAGFADGEWLSGWIALRFLQEYKVALGHFSKMYGTVKYPISRARAAYWAGRAAESLGRRKEAREWFQAAAAYTTPYYGQLAAARLNPDRQIQLPPPPGPTQTEAKAFKANELVRVVRILDHVGQRDRMAPFILRLSGQKTSIAWKSLAAMLAQDRGRPDVAITIAKRANRSGQELIKAGYPTIVPPPTTDRKGEPLETALTLAMIRQESAFYTRAKSSAGARGLMQVMPATARKIARIIKLPYSRRRLITEPQYNLKIGQAYVAHLLDLFNDSYILTLAAYNAGPGRVRKWIRNNGDPRDSGVDPIDWVEMIPFNETRDYVQRVLENLQLYRLRVKGTKVVLNLAGDLRR